MGKWRAGFLWGMLLVYAVARICQLYADQLPTLLIVELHVIPPALFALAHGSVLYRAKDIAVFAVFCLGFGTLAESVGLRTALLILGYAGRSIHGTGVLALPLLASLIMVAWDLSMDPNWSTLDRAWVWQDGGAYFGVPVSNFFGWFFTAYLYYQAFALYSRANPIPAAPSRQSFWLPAIVLYAVCALGNLLILKQPMAPPVVTDAAGKRWLTADILDSCVLVSLLLMAPFALLAWLKTREPAARMSHASAGS
jgi:putative membrane protein